MLYSPNNFSRDQLLVDLLATRELLGRESGWVTGKFHRRWSSVKTKEVRHGYCILGGCQTAVGLEPGSDNLQAKGRTRTEQETRLARMIASVYLALRGPKVDLSMSIYEVASELIKFNDTGATREAVLLLLDRAIATVQAPVTVGEST